VIPRSGVSYSSSTRSGALLPIPVVARKSRIALLHLSSAKRSRILNRSLHLPGPCLTSAHRIFRCIFFSGQLSRRCSRAKRSSTYSSLVWTVAGEHGTRLRAKLSVKRGGRCLQTRTLQVRVAIQLPEQAASPAQPLASRSVTRIRYDPE